ncbi:MAG: hypothetical protein JWM60_282 [Solirubrobacterales bacterium]|nr:hypothetical protein [Solirubrobacterales bacterium]
MALRALVAAALLLGIGAQGASALIVEPTAGKALSYQPLRGSAAAANALAFDKFFSNLDYNGGPVMPSNANYTFYWAPSGSPAYPSGYQSGVDTYLQDLAHDSGGTQNVDSIAAQYNDAAGHFAAYQSSFAGAIVDTNPYPANGCTRAPICLTDAQIQNELVSYITAHGLPKDIVHEYFVLTPPEVESCFTAGGSECSAGSSRPVYCAYHGSIPLSAGQQIVYSNDPFVTGNEGCDDGQHPNGSSDGVLQGGLSHEHNESITDPEPNNAWTDIGGSGGENGDKCGNNMGPALGKAPNGAKYNQVVNGHLYWYQMEWSNHLHNCLQRLSFSGETPTGTFSSAPAGGNKVTFDAGGSTAPGGVSRYNWQFNDGPGLSTPTETTGPTVTHTFPSGGSYLVALTVFASDGTSIGAAHTILAGTPPAPVVAKITPKKGEAAGGTAVTITGSGFTGVTSVHFGANPAASYEVVSSTTITAISPPGTAGAADVTVTNPTGTSATGKGDVFKYGKPSVSAVSPATGPLAGAQSVTVTGSGFAPGGATTLKFGKALASGVNCTSTTSCTAITPAAVKPGPVDVIAAVGKLKSKKTPPGDTYTYS